MKKLVFIAPHLSTGGMPQYLYKQIESLVNDYEIYCLEWDNHTGGKLVVQRNKIEYLLGKRLITIGENKNSTIDYINSIKPDIVHLQEVPEYFMPYEVAEQLYSTNREYVIIETSHDSSFDVNNKLHFPDKFLMVSNYQVKEFQKLGIPTELVEYPIEKKIRQKTREQILLELGLDPNIKHVINVGLFTPRKNQAEVIEYAKGLKDYPIQFHFIGNQADNFTHYWQPLMQDFPSNCKWWGERSDVDTFYQIADLFLFTSRGNNSDKETMPLVIREAISWNIPSLIYNLPVYLNYFEKYSNINYLSYDSDNSEKIIKMLDLKPMINNVELFDDCFNVEFSADENKLSFYYKKQEKRDFKVSIKDKDSNAPMYWFDMTVENYSSWWCIPVPIVAFNFKEEPSFSSFLIELYDTNNTLVFSKDIFVKEATKKRDVKLNIINNFDCLFNNYNEMFVEKKYECYGLNNLDTVLDIGANNGLFSLMLLNSGCKKVYSFEPNKDSLLNLNHMFKDNNSVSVIEKAVYINDNDLEFYVDPNNTTIGSISEKHIHENGTGFDKIIVPAISLKTFVKDNDIQKISLIKMDIEGAEYDIIDNLEDEIFEITDKFLIEWHDNDDGRVETLISKLKSKGYNISQIRNQNDKNNRDLTFSYNTEKVGTFLAVKASVDELLTVVVPCYNHSQYVEECVDSILKQKTLFNYRILLSDDCSTDNTFEIIQKYKDIPNVTITKTNENQGGTPKRIYDIVKNINSNFITFLDADDYYVDELKLQKQINFLIDNPHYSIHSTGWITTAEDAVMYGYYGDVDITMCSKKQDICLEDNIIDANYVSFGFMFNNNFIKNKEFPNWFFNEDVFDGYWALANILLEYGRSKNEDWPSGRYRITPNGEFGYKSEEWKAEKTKRQCLCMRNAYSKTSNPILIVDAFFHDNQCLDTFKKYLTFIKKLDIPIMIVTNSDFDKSLIKDVDYLLYDSNNRLFKKTYKDVDNIVFYYTNEHYYISLGTPGLQKHGLSVLSNLHHSTNLAKELGYTHFYRIEYDCFIDKIDKVKDIIHTVEAQNKKGLMYVNENKFASFQIWYFELEFFTKNFPKINNEDDYIKHKNKFNYHKDFVSAEEFIYNVVKFSENGFSDIIVKDAPLMHSDFGNCVWNSIMTPLESDKIIDGFISSMHRITIKTDSIYIPENSPNDFSKVAFVTWNCSSSDQNNSKAIFRYPNGDEIVIEHEISGPNDHKIDFIDIIDGDINVEIVSNAKHAKTFTINKNTISSLTDVYQTHS